MLALLLLGGQQAAMTHMFAHLPDGAVEGAAVQAVHQEDADHGAAHVLSHLCRLPCRCGGGSCASASVFTLPLAAQIADTLAVAVAPAPSFNQPLAFLSRAPPYLQS
ncbi:MAG: hypothetical protein IPK39_00750 [Sulfuritalea sp.]|nr:hypothetical protein [Sulfuritalea sp.]